MGYMLTQISPPSEILRQAALQSDPEWDDFLACIPGGHHTQTSLWGALKSGHGHKARRIIMRSESGRIIAGAQLLMRPLPFAGTIAYLPKGPVIAPDVDVPETTYRIIQQIHQAAEAACIRYLVIQPPDTGDAIATQLPSLGFGPSFLEVQPSSTVQIDLTPDLDAIFANMKKKTRRFVRKGEAAGFTVREGDRRDIPTFYQLLQASAARNDYTPFPLEYFTRMWEYFAPYGYAHLLLCERGDEPVSAQIVLTFGDTVVSKHIGWSGCYSESGPNHFMDWHTIIWAKERGYRVYDMDGIDRELATAILDGTVQPTPETHKQFYYKLSLGGQIRLFPTAYDYVYHPILRVGYRAIRSHIIDRPILTKALYRLRTR